MVARTLVDRDIRGGHSLLESLDQNKVPVSAALWFYDREEDAYRLFLATSVYDSEGPLKAYRGVQDVLDRLPEDTRPSLTDINIVSPSDETIVAIRTAIKTPTPPAISGIRFSRNLVNNLYVDDAWIYRSN
jgi:hypothetical protein